MELSSTPSARSITTAAGDGGMETTLRAERALMPWMGFSTSNTLPKPPSPSACTMRQPLRTSLPAAYSAIALPFQPRLCPV